MPLSITQTTLQNHRVWLLWKEAMRADPHTFKGRWQYIRQKVRACDGDERSLEDLRLLLRRIAWPIEPQAVDFILREHTKRKSLAAKFDAAVRSEGTVTTLIRKAKARWPIKKYCVQKLRLQFSPDNKCKCPLHNGKSLTSFVIDEKTNKWFCFGDCPHDHGLDYRGGDVIDLHQAIKGFKTPEETARDLLEMSEDTHLSNEANTSSFVSKASRRFKPAAAPPKITSDEKLVAQALRESDFTTLNQAWAAKDFAKLLLERILRPEDLPIVGYRQTSPKFGEDARWALAKCPEKLQYLWVLHCRQWR